MNTTPCDDLHETARQSVGALTRVNLRIGRDLLAIRRSQQFKAYGCHNISHYAERALRLPAHQAGVLVKVAEKLEQFPLLLEAAEQGRISWAALETIINQVTPGTQESWLHLAQHSTTRELKQIVSQISAPDAGPKTRVDWTLHIRTQALVEQAIRKLSEAAQRRLSLDEGLSRMAVQVLTSETLVDGKTVARLEREAELDVAANRARHARVALQLPEDHAGEPLGVRLERAASLPSWENRRLRFNAASRYLSEAQKLELLRREGYRCATPGCPHVLFLDSHHIVFFSQGGETVPENVLLLCSACHRNVHDGYLKLTGYAPDRVVFTDSAGRRLQHFIFYEPADWWEALFDPP